MNVEEFRSEMLAIAARNVENAVYFRTAYRRIALIPLVTSLVISAMSIFLASRVFLEGLAPFVASALGEIGALVMLQLAQWNVEDAEKSFQRWMRYREETLDHIKKVMDS